MVFACTLKYRLWWPIYFIIVVECDDGMVQLVNGEKETEGLLEVCLNGQWGTVCETGFGIMEGVVTCRQLGFGGKHVK